MVGNISVVGNYQELQTLIPMKGEFIKAYTTERNKYGTEFVPNKSKIVVVSDTNSSGNDYIVGSILLPNSLAMFDLIEGDYNGFCKEYFNKLESDPDVQEYLIILLAGLIEMKFDYIFYFDSEDPSMWIPIAKALFDYLGQKYGIRPYSFNEYVENPTNFIQPSIIPERWMEIQNLIRYYKLSNKQESLFTEF